MAEAKKKKGSIREEDVLLLLNMYSPTSVLNLLKEVAQSSGVKIDWNTLVKRSNTGISSAREYQMLWRHLAYRDPFLEKLEAGAEPLDDDSDLEFELEAFSAVSDETSAEAAACVKVCCNRLMWPMHLHLQLLLLKQQLLLLQKCQINHIRLTTRQLLNKPRTSPKMATFTVKPLGGPTNRIQAAAFAAGARIANPSTAASHFKAAESKNAVHVRPRGALASSMSSSKPTSSMTTVGPQPSSIRCNKAPISPKDPAMTTSGPRTTGHQGMCRSSDLLSPSCNATPSNQQPIEHVQIKLSPGPVCADAQGNEDPGSTGAILDTCGALSKEENKCTEEIQFDTPVSRDQVDLLNLDVDLDKAGVDQIGGSKAAGDSTQVGAEREIALNNSDLPCVDITEEAVVTIKSRHEDPMEITPGVPIGGMMEKQVSVNNICTEKDNVANNQMHNSDVVTVVDEENETSQETASQYPVPGDDGTV